MKSRVRHILRTRGVDLAWVALRGAVLTRRDGYWFVQKETQGKYGWI